MVATYDRRGDVIVTGLPLSDVDDTMIRVLLIFVVVAAVALAVATTLGIVITRRALAPLTRVAATARQVANLSLDRGEVALPVRVPEQDANPNTEVGQMGSALNRMLDHISAALSTRQASEMRVRKFVADASHELRTPLTAIRGYTELAQRRRDEVPDEVAHAMGRVASEAERMTHLVEDLLLLARLDSGRPLDTEQVDLSLLAVAPHLPSTGLRAPTTNTFPTRRLRSWPTNGASSTVPPRLPVPKTRPPTTHTVAAACGRWRAPGACGSRKLR